MPISNLTENLKAQNGATSPATAAVPTNQAQENGFEQNTARRQSVSVSFSSTSPHDVFINSIRSRNSFGHLDGTSPTLRRPISNRPAKQLQPFKQENIKVLLLENVNLTGRGILKGQGYQVEALKSSLPEDELIEKIRYDFRVRKPELVINTIVIEMFMYSVLEVRPSLLLVS
jgi:hypothetical protein